MEEPCPKRDRGRVIWKTNDVCVETSFVYMISRLVNRHGLKILTHIDVLWSTVVLISCADCTMCVVDIAGARLVAANSAAKLTQQTSPIVWGAGGEGGWRDWWRWLSSSSSITSGSPNVGVVFPTCLHLPTSPLAWKPLIPKPLSRQRSQTQPWIHILNNSTRGWREVSKTVSPLDSLDVNRMNASDELFIWCN